MGASSSVNCGSLKQELVPMGRSHRIATTLLAIRQSKRKGPQAALFRFGSCGDQRLATDNTFGVMKISSSALSFKRPFFLNRLPRNGMSPRNGTLETLERSVNS